MWLNWLTNEGFTSLQANNGVSISKSANCGYEKQSQSDLSFVDSSKNLRKCDSYVPKKPQLLRSNDSSYSYLEFYELISTDISSNEY